MDAMLVAMLVAALVAVSLLQQPCLAQRGAHRVALHVDASPRPLPDLPAFWSSTGFSAPSAAAAETYLLSEEMEWNLAYIGAMPRAAIRQVRAHWLLQLVHARRSPRLSRCSEDQGRGRGRGQGCGHGAAWHWDFTRLDRFLDSLERNGLRPGFEMMGVPPVEARGLPSVPDPPFLPAAAAPAPGGPAAGGGPSTCGAGGAGVGGGGVSAAGEAPLDMMVEAVGKAVRRAAVDVADEVVVEAVAEAADTLGCVAAVEAVGEAVHGALGRAARPLPRPRPRRLRPRRPRPLISDIARQADLWRCLVKSTVAHVGDRYGSDAVKTWRFETWNEPDLRQYNTLNWTVDGYMAYFNATVRGLRDAEKHLNVSLRLGGPAGIFKTSQKHPICWHVLDHCNRLSAVNQSCGLDFISFHRKGNGSSRGVTDGTMALLQQILGRFPHLRHVPFANDEADPLTGWWRQQGWRGDLRYAIMIVNAVVDLQDKWRRHQDCTGRRPAEAARGGGGPTLHVGVHVDTHAHAGAGGAEECLPPLAPLPPLEVLSNDNGFLETSARHFSQRTLLARFHRPAGPAGPDSAGGVLHMFRKPAMTATALLAFMEGSQLPVRTDIQPPLEDGLRLSVLASLGSLGSAPPGAEAEGEDAEGAVISLLVAFGNETQPADDRGPEAEVTVCVSRLPFGGGGARGGPRGGVVLARVWALRTSPMDPWLAAGAPQRPPAPLRRDMRAAEVPRLDQAREFPLSAGSADVTLTFAVPFATISMLQVFTPPAKPPRSVIGLRARNVTYDEVLLLWSDDDGQSRHVTAYEVSFRPGPTAPFSVISPVTAAVGEPWMLFPAFHYAPGLDEDPPGSSPGSSAGFPPGSRRELTRGEYRVAAVNAWGLRGPASSLAYPAAA